MKNGDVEGSENRKSRRTQGYLDARITLIPRGYAFTLCCILIAVAAIGFWAIFGNVPIKTGGSGIIVESGRQLFAVQSESDGRVHNIKVVTGNEIGHGDVVAEINQSNLDIQIIEAKGAVQELETKLESLKQRSAAKLTRHEQAYADMQKVYASSITELTTSQKLLQELLDDEQKIERRGLVTRSNLLENRQSYISAVVQLADLRTKLADAQQTLAQLKIDAADKIDVADEALNTAKRSLQKLEAMRSTGGVVLAPSAGRIEEIRVAEGQNVTATTVIMTVSKGGDGFEVIAFLDPLQARRVEVGMPAHIVPSSVSKAEFGTMRGTVAAVSSAPVSEAAADVFFRDEKLIQHLMSAGETYLTRISLDVDKKTESGFKWWAGEGPPYEIAAGTLAEVEIVLAERPPVSFVVPAVRELLGF